MAQRIVQVVTLKAPADSRRGMPLRDVDHDMLAAGHPRLEFEFAAFMANIPSSTGNKLPTFRISNAVKALETVGRWPARFRACRADAIGRSRHPSETRAAFETLAGIRRI